jgi:hypothetical protein
MIEPVSEPSDEEKKQGVPTGLLRPEKKVDDDQMADFSTPIEELTGPSPMSQPDAPPMMMNMLPSGPAPVRTKKKAASANPFGLTDAQFYAALAGVAAVIAHSDPVQGRLSTMIPRFLSESGKQTTTGMVATALVAAVLFYFARKFIMEKS